MTDVATAAADARARAGQAAREATELEARVREADLRREVDRQGRIHAWAERTLRNWPAIRNSRLMDAALAREAFDAAVAAGDLQAAFAAHVDWREKRGAIAEMFGMRRRARAVLGMEESPATEHSMPEQEYRDGVFAPTFDQELHRAIEQRVIVATARAESAIVDEIQAAANGEGDR